MSVTSGMNPVIRFEAGFERTPRHPKTGRYVPYPHRLWPLSTPLKQITQEFGTGISIYFSHIRYAFFLCALFLLCYTPSIIQQTVRTVCPNWLA
ncbi:hypothetical protein KIPB_012713, partial [Kipferlia bialata]|eukprot:g12713.t1